ncbi:MAG: glycosyltransferase family 2 protein [Chitinispirillaceae bacterium]
MMPCERTPVPQISVCMATYNGERFLYSQLESISAQIKDTDEIVISDDRSTDGTIDIIREFPAPNIRLLRKKGLRGISANFNNALSHAEGRFIFLADQDDIWNPDKVEQVMNELHSHVLVLSDCEVIDASGETIAPSLFDIRGIGYTGFWRNVYKNSFTGCAMAFQHSLLETALPVPSNIPMYDWWLGLISQRLGKVAVINKPLVKYRVHGENASPTGTGSNYSPVEKLAFRLRMLASIFSRLYLKRSPITRRENRYR